MAKVRLPLLSGQASGAFAKTIAFYRCGNIQTARKSNPPAQMNSPLQKDQQALFSEATAILKSWPLTELDLSAWSRWGRDWGSDLPARNVVLSQLIASLKSGNTWTKLWDFQLVAKTNISLTIAISADPALNFPWYSCSYARGYKPPDDMMLPVAPGRFQATITGLQKTTRYYVRIYSGQMWTDYGHTGTYQVYTRPWISGP